MRRTFLGCLVALAFAAQPAASEAALTTLGSDLTSPANVAEAHGADAAFWGVALAGGGATRIPTYGQITTIRLKGVMLTAGGAPAPFTGGSGNFQALSPAADGSVTVRQSSQPVDVPSGGDPNRITTFVPEHLCVRPGEYVGFTDYGGFNPQFYPNGVPFRIFSRVPGSSTNFFTRDGGTKTGSTLTPTPRQNQELLMQMVLATGNDVGPLCPRGPRRKFAGVRVRRQTADAFVNKGYARIRSTCPADQGLCSGRMTATTTGGRRATLGSTRFSLGPGNTRAVRLPLTGRARRLIRGRRVLRAIVRTAVRNRYDQRAVNRSRVRLKARLR